MFNQHINRIATAWVQALPAGRIATAFVKSLPAGRILAALALVLPAGSILAASCDGINGWEKNAIYLKGQTSQQQGTLYQAKWWTQGRARLNPGNGMSGTPWGLPEYGAFSQYPYRRAGADQQRGHGGLQLAGDLF